MSSETKLSIPSEKTVAGLLRSMQFKVTAFLLYSPPWIQIRSGVRLQCHQRPSFNLECKLNPPFHHKTVPARIGSSEKNFCKNVDQACRLCLSTDVHICISFSVLRQLGTLVNQAGIRPSTLVTLARDEIADITTRTQEGQAGCNDYNH